jgi:hypothetical protein
MSESPIIVRNLHFPLGEVPRDWMPSRPAVARFLDQLSLIFPRGERFFIESVRPFERQLPAALREQVRKFTQQEALHSREHQALNDHLAQLGYPVAQIVRDAERFADHAATWSPRTQLAFTCAIEHFTAVLGRMALEDESVLAGGHPIMVALWRWHAVEETEHASVAFDVYRATGGGYFRRVVVMLYATVAFWGRIALRQPSMLAVDGSQWSFKSWWDLSVFLFGRPGVARRAVRPYLAYLRPSFHPRDVDSSGLVASWRAEYERSPLYQQMRTKERSPRSGAVTHARVPQSLAT